MNHAEEMGQILFKTCGNPAIILQFEEEVFHQMAVFIKTFIIHSSLFGVLAAWYNGSSAFLSDGINQCLAVISLICKHMTVFQIKQGDQIPCWRMVANFSSRQMDLYGIAQSVHYGMDLGGISTSRTTNSLFFVPPFPPLPCWWTRMYEPSIMYSSSSRS